MTSWWEHKNSRGTMIFNRSQYKIHKLVHSGKIESLIFSSVAKRDRLAQPTERERVEGLGEGCEWADCIAVCQGQGQLEGGLQHLQ